VSKNKSVQFPIELRWLIC